ncbi:MAG TPA: hypothetical protein VGK87_12145 [Anaerolineae bacterium]|jgi:hypothetical protein
MFEVEISLKGYRLAGIYIVLAEAAGCQVAGEDDLFVVSTDSPVKLARFIAALGAAQSLLWLETFEIHESVEGSSAAAGTDGQ